MEDIQFKNYKITDLRTGEEFSLPDFLSSLEITREESELIEKYYDSEAEGEARKPKDRR